MEVKPRISENDQPKAKRSIIVLLHASNENAMQNVGRNLQCGCLKRLKDEDLGQTAIELTGANFQTNFIFFPRQHDQLLNISADYRFLMIYTKNVNKHMSIEFAVADSNGIIYRFRLSTMVNLTRIKPFLCVSPLKLDDGWNRISIDLSSMCKKAFKFEYTGLARLQISANCRLRRVFLARQDYDDEYLNNITDDWLDSTFETRTLPQTN